MHWIQMKRKVCDLKKKKKKKKFLIFWKNFKRFDPFIRSQSVVENWHQFGAEKKKIKRKKDKKWCISCLNQTRSLCFFLWKSKILKKKTIFDFFCHSLLLSLQPNLSLMGLCVWVWVYGLVCEVYFSKKKREREREREQLLCASLYIKPNFITTPTANYVVPKLLNLPNQMQFFFHFSLNIKINLNLHFWLNVKQT